jgi:hypothetical protein
MRSAERMLARLSAYIESGPSDTGEYRIRCPKHGERRASASANINPEKGMHGSWYCMVCEEGGNLKALADWVDELPDSDPRKMSATGIVLDFGEHLDKKRGPIGAGEERLSEAKVLGWHAALMDNRQALEHFKERRGLSEATLRQFKIGFESSSGRYTIPIYDEGGNLVNIRRYSTDPDSFAKLTNAKGHGSPPRLFPVDQLREAGEGGTVLITEGELDALIAVQHGFAAVSGTGGAKRWDPTWAKQFAGMVVFVSYDNDHDGRVGARKVAHALRPHAAAVAIVPPLVEEEKSDITDYFQNGGTTEDLIAILEECLEPGIEEQDALEKAAEPADVRVIGSMDSKTNGQPLSMAVTITGRKDPTYSVPHRIHFECSMDAGAKCKICPMLTSWEGEHKATIRQEDIRTISEFIDAKKTSAEEVARKHFGIQKCNRLDINEEEAHTVEELFVMSSVDAGSHDQTDYTQRRIYHVGGDGSTRTNTEVRVVGTTTPSPRDRRNEFYSWGMRESVTSIDSFVVDADVVRSLSIFRPEAGQPIWNKCWDIAKDLSTNVTRILGRERLHIAMDLAWHSALHFEFEGKRTPRGWLEVLVVGDTRTGKSETAIRLSDHYGLGHVIGCEGATFAGLVGGVKEVGGSRTITWGEITVNDRRLVVLDEVSGLSQDIIGQMSDIRSRGVAQITKIETATTNARARAIWISNPRKAVGERAHYGIDIISGLIGNPEDIARFDLAMSVSRDDVPSEKINSTERASVPHVYTSDLCQQLVLWAWSRKAEQIIWKPDAYAYVFEAANRLGSMYVEDPPLIQASNVREKIARVAVAFAMRTFSTDDSGECVVVERGHVATACNFINKLYSYDNFGYRRRSKRTLANQQKAKESRVEVARFLRENPRLLHFLLDRTGSFRAADLEEMTHMQKDEANTALGTLSDAKMIYKERAQIVIAPELHNLLRELEDD